MPDIYESEVFVQYYDLAPIYNDRSDAAFYLVRAKEARGPVLELGCGSGRVLVPIAREGIEITGFDASPAMLKQCQAKLCEANLGAETILGDMRHFDLGRKFALITIPFRPFLHLLDPPDQIACLDCVRRHLAPGGRFIFDVFDPRLDILASENRLAALEYEFTGPQGHSMQRSARRVRHDRARQVIHMELIFTDKQTGVQQTMPLVMRYCFRYELEHLLDRCGFEVIEVLGDFDGSPVGDVCKELIFTSIVSSSQ